MSKLTVQVNKTNIRQGVKESSSACPIALRLAAMGFPYVEVTGDRIVFCSDWKWPVSEAIVEHPALSFVQAFDRGEPVVPFDFEIEVPDEVLGWRRRPEASR